MPKSRTGKVSKTTGKISGGRGGGKKDPTAPKEPLKPFTRFLGDIRDELKQQHPNLPGKGAYTKLAGERWRALTEAEKQTYKDAFASEMPEYRVRLTKWRAEQEAAAEQELAAKAKKRSGKQRKPIAESDTEGDEPKAGQSKPTSSKALEAAGPSKVDTADEAVAADEADTGDGIIFKKQTRPRRKAKPFEQLSKAMQYYRLNNSTKTPTQLQADKSFWVESSKESNNRDQETIDSRKAYSQTYEQNDRGKARAKANKAIRKINLDLGQRALREMAAEDSDDETTPRDDERDLLAKFAADARATELARHHRKRASKRARIADASSDEENDASPRGRRAASVASSDDD